MTSRITRQFREALAKHPANVRRQATIAYRKFRENPHHPSLRFKKVHASQPIYSARVKDDYRAIGLVRDDAITGFWIGKHEEHERLLKEV